MRILDIKEGTMVDGPGLRTSIYFAGCRHHCEGCHNPQSWDFAAGHDMTEDELIEVIRYNRFDVTYSGGDPLYQLEAVTSLSRRIKAELGKTIWCFTGYRWEQLVGTEPSGGNPEDFRRFLETIDVLVDSPFVQAKRNTSLLFRGSENQRIIDVQASLRTGEVVLMKEYMGAVNFG